MVIPSLLKFTCIHSIHVLGLFQAAILESGSFLSPWAYQRRARQISFATAAFLNSSWADSDDSQALLDYLLTVDARTLDSAAEQYRSWVTHSNHSS